MPFEVSATYGEDSYSEVTRMIEEKWLGGDDHFEWGEMVESAVDRRRPWQFQWKAKPGLSLVALHAMHHFAKKVAHVPLKPLDKGFPNDLQDLFDALVAQRSLSEARKKEIRLKYAHFSVQNSIGYGPEPSGYRRVFNS